MPANSRDGHLHVPAGEGERKVDDELRSAPPLGRAGREMMTNLPSHRVLLRHIQYAHAQVYS